MAGWLKDGDGEWSDQTALSPQLWRNTLLPISTKRRSKVHENEDVLTSLCNRLYRDFPGKVRELLIENPRAFSGVILLGLGWTLDGVTRIVEQSANNADQLQEINAEVSHIGSRVHELAGDVLSKLDSAVERWMRNQVLLWHQQSARFRELTVALSALKAGQRLIFSQLKLQHEESTAIQRETQQMIESKAKSGPTKWRFTLETDVTDTALPPHVFTASAPSEEQRFSESLAVSVDSDSDRLPASSFADDNNWEPLDSRNLIGRKKEQRKLKSKLIGTAKSPAAPCVVALTGMPGVGKTWLAESFVSVWKEHHEHNAEFICLEPRGDENDAEALFRLFRDELCDRFKIRRDTPNRQAALAHRLAQPGCLLLIENVDGEPIAAAAARLLAFVCNRAYQPRALITSRMSEVGFTRNWIEIEILPFKLNEARKQIQNELGTKHWRRLNGTELDDLVVNKLGGLPLAISLASGHLRRWTCSQFWEQLQATGLNLKPADPTDQREAARTILAASFRLTWNALRQSLSAWSEISDELMNGLASLGYAVPSGFGPKLGAAIAGLEFAPYDALCAAACRFNLLQVVNELPQFASRDGHRYRVHPLVGTYLRIESDELATNNRETQWFLEILNEPVQGDWNPRWKELIDESDALKYWLEKVISDEQLVLDVSLAGARFAQINGPFGLWKEVCERALAVSTCDHESSDLLLTVGRCALNLGDIPLATRCAEEKKLLDEARQDFISASLATDLTIDVLRVDGKTGDAIELIRECQIPFFKNYHRAWFEELSAEQLADILESTGHFDLAQRLRVTDSPLEVEWLGLIRPYAATMGKLGELLIAQGEIDEAFRIFSEEELPIYESNGDQRLQAITKGNLARIYEF
jgi:hypothetical protein